MTPNNSISIEVQDFEGPVPTIIVKQFDYYLLLSWLFLIIVGTDLLLRKTQFKHYVITFFKRLLANNRQMQLPQPPHRPMIQNQDHLHVD